MEVATVVQPHALEPDLLAEPLPSLLPKSIGSFQPAGDVVAKPATKRLPRSVEQHRARPGPTHPSTLELGGSAPHTEQRIADLERIVETLDPHRAASADRAGDHEAEHVAAPREEQARRRVATRRLLTPVVHSGMSST
jgi:hypothetical protein